MYIIIKLIIHRDFSFALIGNFFYSTKKYAKSINWYKRAAKTNIAQPQYITNYAYMELKFGNIDAAGENINYILSKRIFKGKDLFTIQITQALIEWKKDNIDNCIYILENIYKNNYKAIRFYEIYGYLLLVKGDLDRALALNNEAFEHSKESAVITANLAETYYKLGNFEKAEELFKPLTEEQINFAEPYYYYALILNKTGEKVASVTLLNKALSLGESFLSNLTKENIEETLKSISP